MKTNILIFSIGVFLFLSPISRAQWTQTGPPVGSIYSLAVSDSNVFAATDSGVYRSTNNGQNWSLTLDGQYAICLAISGSNVFATTGSILYRSTDNGNNWTLTLETYDGYIDFLAISGSNVFAGANGDCPPGCTGAVYRSTDNGQNWDIVFETSRGVSSLAVNDSNVFAGSTDHGLYRSTNNGNNWSGIFPLSFGPIAINTSNVFGGRSVLVYRSTNNGENWTASDVNGQSIYSLAISDSNIFAGTYSTGVYLSTNNGQNWTQWNQGLGNPTVYALAVNSTYIFAGAYNTSVWKRPLSDTLVGLKGIGSSIPEKYYLFQNYPNPFNPATSIKYSIPRGSFVTLKVYDMLGKEVTTLVNQMVNPGSYEIFWDATNYTSGIYFYKLISDEHSETKRMVLIK